jgi:hypothetical protein
MRNRPPLRPSRPVAETVERRTYLTTVTPAAAKAPAVTAPIVVLRSHMATPQGYSSPSGAPITPALMRAAYGLGTYGSSNVTFNGVQGNGAGQTIAIIAGGNDPTIANDVDAFSSYWGLPDPPSFKVMNASGSTTGLPSDGDEGETALDVEWSHVMAPMANIDLFEGSIYTGVTTALSTTGVSVISISYNISGTESNSEFETPSGHTGVTVFGASGDSAGDVNEPGKSASVVSVGGTDLTMDGNAYGSETAWSAGGGGIASGIAQPTYQKVKAAPYSTAYRTTPDVSADADPGTGVAVYDTTDNTTAAPWTAIVGGTSLATPLWAGVVAVADQGRVAAGLTPMDGYTQTLPRLYTLPSAAFHDVTSGSNANPAKAGYDLATGLGTPAGAKLIPDLAGADTIAGTAFLDANNDGTYDAGDTVLANQAVYLDVGNTGVQASTDPTATTNASGQYTFADVIGGLTGIVRLATTPAGYLHTTSTAVTTAYDTTQTVNIGLERSPYAAAASPTTVTGRTTGLSVTGTAPPDASSCLFTWATTSAPSGGSATFSPNGTYAARGSTATFTKAGSYTFTLTITDGQGGSATTTVSVTVSQVESGVTVTPATSTIDGTKTEQLSASAVDQFGNALSTQPTFAWAITAGEGSVSSAGLYTPPATDGTIATVQATAGSYSGTTTVNVLAGTFTSADVGSPTLAGSATDNAGTFTVAGSGTGFGGTADQFQFVYQSLAGNGAILARVATQSDTAAGAIAGVMIRQSLAANSVGALMAVTPADGVVFASRTSAGGAVASQFATAATAPYWVKLVRTGTILAGYYSADGVTWTAAFLALAPLSGPVYVGLAVSSATNAALSTATFDHVDLSPTVYTAASASPTTVTGTTAALSVLGYDENGEPNLTYAWAATAVPAGATAPTFSANGTNAAKSTTATFTKAGAYTFTVTITDSGGLTATSATTVTVVATASSVVVTPGSATVAAGATTQLTAIAYDQFGNTMGTNAPVTWTVDAGGVGGTVSSTGLYAAPATDTGGTDTVRATVGGISGTATVTVLAATTDAVPAPPPPPVMSGVVGPASADWTF